MDFASLMQDESFQIIGDDDKVFDMDNFIPEILEQHEVETSLPNTKYTITKRTTDVDNFYDIKGELIHLDAMEPIAQFQCWLNMRRENEEENFHDLYSEVEEPTQRCFVNLFDHHGVPRGELLTPGPNTPKAFLNTEDKHKGGVMFIEQAYFLDEIKDKRESSLELLKLLLNQFREEYFVAFIVPESVSYSLFGEDLDDKSQESALSDTMVTKLCHHFARLGFQQLSNFPPECTFWVLRNPSDGVVVTEEDKSLNIVLTPCNPTLEGLEQQAVECIKAGELEKLKELKDQGVDFDQALAIHTAVLCNNAEAVKRVLECGGDVNKCDALGETPLHIAANVIADEESMEEFKVGYEILQTLINVGGDKSKKNLRNETPHDTAIRSKRYQEDFIRVFGLEDTPEATMSLLRNEKVISLLKE